MSRTALVLIVGLAPLACGGKAPPPASDPPTEASEDPSECHDESGSEWPCGVEPDDADCFDGPSASLFDADYGEDGSLWFNGCDWDAAGPAQVITYDGHVHEATAEIDSELDASYRVVPIDFEAPADAESALVIVPASATAKIVALSNDVLDAIGDVLVASYELPANLGPPKPVVAVDVDGDGLADAAIVHGCYRVAAERCSEDGDLFVRRVNGTTWIVPYAYPQ